MTEPEHALLDTRRKRLLYRSTHRGTHENDLLIGGFVAVALLSVAVAPVSCDHVNVRFVPVEPVPVNPTSAPLVVFWFVPALAMGAPGKPQALSGVVGQDRREQNAARRGRPNGD